MESIFSAIFAVNKDNLDQTGIEKRDSEREAQLKLITQLASSRYAIPLFLLFGISDFLYYESYFIFFMALRITTVVAIFLINRQVQKSIGLRAVQTYCTLILFSASFPINLMMFTLKDFGSPYYAGLILVVIGTGAGFRFEWPFYLLNIALAIAPLAIFGLARHGMDSGSFFWINLLFLIGTSLIISVSRAFNEMLVLKELNSRLLLQDELRNRDKIIEEKTTEALNLTVLTKQFSPQVVHAIELGKLELMGKVHRSEIGAIFVDIVNSTERFVRLDQDDIQQTLSYFLEDTTSTLLKYDITVDKFLGDGVLGFCNDPIRHTDYIERLLLAACEIKDRINSRRSSYEELWLGDFDIRIGIATGYASVGFYGTNLSYRTYTAIGRVVNLATRVTSSAEPNKILVSQDVVSKLKRQGTLESQDFSFTPIEVKKFKGFESEMIHVYEVTSKDAVTNNQSSGHLECPNGHGLLYLDNDEAGVFIFKCRKCSYVENKLHNVKKIAS